MHAIVHAWNYVILLDFNNKLCAGTELHVVVHAWNYVIMMDSNKKLCAGTKTHVDVSLFNCVICSKSVFVTELWCLQWVNVRCWIVLSAANQCSLSNYGVCSKSGFPCRIVLFATNQVFVAELCCLQRISFCRQMVVSAPNQFLLQNGNYGVTSESVHW